jgi:hypothetical protein
MSLIVNGDERYIRNMPVVGIRPTMYGFNNLRSTLHPYLNQNPYPYLNPNEIQFYNPIYGSLYSSYKPADTINNLMQGFTNNPNYNVIQQNQGINTFVYNTNNINVGLIGSSDDLLKVRQILDKHFENANKTVVTPTVDTSTAKTSVL